MPKTVKTVDDFLSYEDCNHPTFFSFLDASLDAVLRTYTDKIGGPVLRKFEHTFFQICVMLQNLLVYTVLSQSSCLLRVTPIDEMLSTAITTLKIDYVQPYDESVNTDSMILEDYKDVPCYVSFIFIFLIDQLT
jgi:hypothetical protein